MWDDNVDPAPGPADEEACNTHPTVEAISEKLPSRQSAYRYGVSPIGTPGAVPDSRADGTRERVYKRGNPDWQHYFSGLNPSSKNFTPYYALTHFMLAHTLRTPKRKWTYRLPRRFQSRLRCGRSGGH